MHICKKILKVYSFYVSCVKFMKTLTAIVDKKFCRIDREKKLYFCFDFDDVEPVYRYMIVMRFAKAYLFSLSRNNYFKILPLSAQRGLKQPPKK